MPSDMTVKRQTEVVTNDNTGAVLVGRTAAPLGNKSTAGTIASAITKSDVLGGHRSLANARRYRNDFYVQLGLQDLNTAPEAEDLIREIDFFIVDVILGISYYTQSINTAKWQRWLYCAFITALILMIPVFLSVLSYQSYRMGGSVIVAQVVGGLAAIAGLQKVLGALAGTTQRYVIWRSTSATLKTLWYGLLTKWSPAGSRTPMDRVAFLADLVARRQAARVAIDAEQDDYFKILALPTIDILSTVTTAAAAATGVVSGLVPGSSTLLSSAANAAKRAAEAVQAQNEVVRNTSFISYLNQTLSETTAQLAGADTAAAATLQSQLSNLRGSIFQANTALMTAKAALSVAQQPAS